MVGNRDMLTNFRTQNDNNSGMIVGHAVENPPIQETIELGLVPRLVELSTHEDNFVRVRVLCMI